MGGLIENIFQELFWKNLVWKMINCWVKEIC